MSTCRDDKEFLQIKKRMLACVKLIHTYQWIIDAYVSDFFTHDHWKRFPKKWQSYLSDLEPEEMAWFLDPDNTTIAPHCRSIIPLSLLAFKASIISLALARNQIDVDADETLQAISKEKNKSSQIPVLSSYGNCGVKDFDKRKIVDTGERSNFKDGQYLPLKSCFRKHVKPKKQHEILNLGKVINQLSYQCKCTNVVDVGAGQGHLSRLLAFMYKLKVTTVEAVGCHAPKAEKIDREIKRNIQHGSRKRKHQKDGSSNADQLTKKEGKDGTNNPNSSDHLMQEDILTLPDHVTCVIQPDATVKKFLDIVHSSLIRSVEETSPNVSQTETSSPKASARLKHSTDHDLDKCLSSDAGNKHLLDKKFIMTGLHACGDLSATMLRVFANSSDISALASVACCYMKLTSRDDKGSSETGYPMSSTVTNTINSSLSYEAREMACHFADTYKQRLKDNPPNLKSHCYRAALQSIIVKHDPTYTHKCVKLNVKFTPQLTFHEYARQGLAKAKIIADSKEEDWEFIEENFLPEWKNVVAFYTLRLSLSPVVETLILLDRMIFLYEKGFPSHIMPIFDPALSPRNFVLVAQQQQKSQT